MTILIVGAGPTGLTAAVELARRNILPRVIDRSEGPTPLSKAVGINANSLALLEPSGITERLLAEGIRIRHGHLWFEGRHLAAIQLDHLKHRFNFLLSLPQSETERILEMRFAELGGGVERRTRLLALPTASDRPVARIEGPDGTEETAFDLILGADGIHSTVREAVGLPFEGHDHARTWSIADAEIADWPYEPESINLFLHRNGDVGFIVPISKGRFRAVSNSPDALAQVPGSYRIKQVLVSDAFPIAVRQAPDYRKGRVFLAGDAAHVHSPAGGRGMNTGIGDAAAFARRTADNDLDGYSAERRPAGEKSIKMSEALVRMAQLTNPALVTLRSALLPRILSLPPIQEGLAKDLLDANS